MYVHKEYLPQALHHIEINLQLHILSNFLYICIFSAQATKEDKTLRSMNIGHNVITPLRHSLKQYR